MLTFTGIPKAKSKTVFSANPHREILTLFNITLEKIGKAREAIVSHKVKDKTMYIGMSINLLDALKSHLNEFDGELVKNFRNEYGEMQYALLQANLKNDEKSILMVSDRLSQYKSTWEAIPKKYQYLSNPKSIAHALDHHVR